MDNKKDSLLIDRLHKVFSQNIYGLNATRANIKYGELFLPFCSVMIHDQEDYEEFERILDLKYEHPNISLNEEEESIFRQRMQLYAHEYFHFYQLMALPTMQYQALIEQRYLKFTAIVLLRYFEQCEAKGILPEIKNSEYSNLLALIDRLDDFAELAHLKEQIKTFNQFAIYYTEIWSYEEDGISTIALIESMAHIYSLQMTQSTDQLGLEENRIYTDPYHYFLKHINEEQLDRNTKYLLFLYVVFFSLKNHNIFEDSVKSRVVTTFKALCSNMHIFLRYLSNRKAYYGYLGAADLDMVLNEKALFPEQLTHATRKQKSSLAAFFDTIELLKEESKKYSANKAPSDSLKSFATCKRSAIEYGFDPDNLYTLASMSIFPENFGYLMDMHDTYMKQQEKEVEFDRRKEMEFYQVIKNCNNLLDRKREIKCCEEHGFVSDKKRVRNCSNHDSFAILIKDFLHIDIKDLFWIY